tara:strand:+ start:1031 stop:1219 length:189 start_codon:yes stop_codon:yes gene_type:complete
MSNNQKYYANLIANSLQLKVRVKQLEKQLKKEKEKRISWNDGNQKLIEGQWYVKGTDFWKND